MQNGEICIETIPRKQDIDDVLLWLKDERDSNGISFYNNRNVIENSFERGNSIVLKHGSKNVGIVIWHGYDECEGMRVDIDIFVIHPHFRRQGYGGLYYKAVSDFFRSGGFQAVKLFCEPRTSESFWIKMGLVKFPSCELTEHELTYYGILVDVASIEYLRKADKIELWNVEPYDAEKIDPKWTWYVEIQNTVLLYPIIHPCNCNWNLRWSRNGVTLKEAKVKYFGDEDYKFYCSQFLCIDKLKE